MRWGDTGGVMNDPGDFQEPCIPLRTVTLWIPLPYPSDLTYLVRFRFRVSSPPSMTVPSVWISLIRWKHVFLFVYLETQSKSTLRTRSFQSCPGMTIFVSSLLPNLLSDWVSWAVNCYFTLDLPHLTVFHAVASIVDSNRNLTSSFKSPRLVVQGMSVTPSK